MDNQKAFDNYKPWQLWLNFLWFVITSLKMTSLRFFSLCSSQQHCPHLELIYNAFSAGFRPCKVLTVVTISVWDSLCQIWHNCTNNVLLHFIPISSLLAFSLPPSLSFSLSLSLSLSLCIDNSLWNQEFICHTVRCKLPKFGPIFNHNLKSLIKMTSRIVASLEVTLTQSSL